MAETADALADKGAAVFITSDAAAQGAHGCPFAATGHPLTDPLALIVSFYAFVEAFARHARPQSRPAAQSAQGDGDAMSGRFAITGARIFDGDKWHDEAALVGVGRQQSRASFRRRALRPAMAVVEAAGGMLVPGFVDLQVNGGGGVMLNDRPDVETIRTICAAHAPFGTTALLATLITDTPAQSPRRRSPPASRRRG